MKTTLLILFALTISQIAFADSSWLSSPIVCYRFDSGFGSLQPISCSSGFIAGENLPAEPTRANCPRPVEKWSREANGYVLISCSGAGKNRAEPKHKSRYGWEPNKDGSCKFPYQRSRYSDTVECVLAD
jgi:hypothetical protein